MDFPNLRTCSSTWLPQCAFSPIPKMLNNNSMLETSYGVNCPVLGPPSYLHSYQQRAQSTASPQSQPNNRCSVSGGILHHHHKMPRQVPKPASLFFHMSTS